MAHEFQHLGMAQELRHQTQQKMEWTSANWEEGIQGEQLQMAVVVAVSGVVNVAVAENDLGNKLSARPLAIALGATSPLGTELQDSVPLRANWLRHLLPRSHQRTPMTVSRTMGVAIQMTRTMGLFNWIQGRDILG